MVGIGLAIAELARVEPSIATFVIIHGVLAPCTLESLGSEAQQQKWLPKMRDLDAICSWALTETKTGSDASSIQTSTTRVEGGYRLNGDKRWIGLGNRDVMIVWARSVETKKVEGYILELNTPGIDTQIIKHKLVMRPIINCQLRFNNVFIPKENHMPKATDFSRGTNSLLKHSRVFICWVAVGMALGVYDNVIKYVMERKQFGVPIASFQL